NESWFNALPGGYRDGVSSSFSSIRYIGNWWSSTEYSTSNAWYRNMCYINGICYRDSFDKHYGISIRCLKD
ncbi:MAG: hypothetical protein J0651_03920, partial [Actinobacteria bacterium]|nr:hypothetical protein [Actinomycetota bacterium]